MDDLRVSVYDDDVQVTVEGSFSINGSDGIGVPSGGLTNQLLSKKSSVDFDTQWITPTAPDLMPEDFNAVGDGIADDTIPFLQFLELGGGRLRDGATYLIDAMEITVPQWVRMAGCATIKARSVPVDADAEHYVLKFTGLSQVTIRDRPIIDFNADLTWPTMVNDDHEWAAIICEDCFNINIDVEVTGSPRWAVRFSDCSRTKSQIYAYECGGLAKIEFGSDHVVDWLGENLNNDHDGDVSPGHFHIADVWEADDVSGKISIRTFTGATVPGYSTFLSGVTIVNCDGVSLVCSVLDGESVDLNVLCVSMVSCYRWTLFPTVRSEFGLGIEFSDCLGGLLDNPRVDGMWRIGTITQRMGIACKVTGLYHFPDRNRRTLGAGYKNQIRGGYVQRTYYGLTIRSPNWEIDGLDCSGNIINGYRLDNEGLSSGSAGVGVIPGIPQDIILRNIISRYNGAAGVAIANGKRIRLFNQIIENNGQDAVSSTASIGLVFDRFDPQAGPLTDLLVAPGGIINDNQYGGTTLASVSFEPQTPEVFMPDTAYPYQVKVTRLIQGLGNIGQQLTFVGVAAGADVKAKILDIDRDEMILACPTNADWTNAGLVSFLTGTWSGSGETLTGVGTDASGEIRGGDWINTGVEWRQVESVATDTSITINAAFSVPLAGTTLEVLRAGTTEIPSQQYGVRLDDALCTDVRLGQFVGRGNIVSPVFPYYTNLRPGSIIVVAGNSNFAGTAATTPIPVFPKEWVVEGIAFKVTASIDVITGLEAYVRDNDGAARIGAVAVASSAAVVAGSAASGASRYDLDNPKVNRVIRLDRTGAGTPTVGAAKTAVRLRLDGAEIPLT